MAGSKSIILHLDSMPQWDMLSDDQAGKLIKSLLTYAKTGEQPQSDDKLLLMAFSFFASQVERDGQKYAKKCETNKRIAEERESRKREERARTCTNVHERAPEENARAFSCSNNNTDNDNDNNTDNDSESDNNTDAGAAVAAEPRHTRTRSEIKQVFNIPTVDAVKAYCKEINSSIDAQRFVDYYQAIGWQKSGRPITDWKAVVRMWDDIERKKARSPSRREADKANFDLDAFKALKNNFDGFESMKGGSFDLEDFRPLINNFGDSSIDMDEVDKLMNPLAGPEVSTA